MRTCQTNTQRLLTVRLQEHLLPAYAHPRFTPVALVAFCPMDDTVFAVGYRGAGVAIFSTSHVLPIAVLPMECDDVEAVAWGAHVAVLDAHGRLTVWRAVVERGALQEPPALLHDRTMDDVVAVCSHAAAMRDGRVVQLL